MNVFACERCGLIAKTKGNYKAHIYKVHPCTPNLSDVSMEEIQRKYEWENTKETNFKCPHCNKSFACRQSKSKHATTCRFKGATIAYNTPPPAIQILNINQPVFNTVVKVRDFSDTYDLGAHLTPEFLTQTLLTGDIAGLVRALYCDPAHPETHCIRMRNRKERIFDTIENGEIRPLQGNAVIREVIDNAMRKLSSHYRENREDLIELLEEHDRLHKVRKMFDDYNADDPKFYGPLIHEVAMVFDGSKVLPLKSLIHI